MGAFCDVRWIIRAALALLPAAGFAACSGGDGGDTPAATTTMSLDCAWLASDNCWKKTIAAASACLPDQAAVGTLSSDGATCTFTTGQTVTFDPPVTLPLNLMSKVSFAMTTNGAPCFSFKWSDANSFVVSTSAGTVTVGASEPLTEAIQCPDGSRVSNTNALSLLSCDAGVFGGLPGQSWSGGDTSITVEAVGTSAPGYVPIFTCQM